MNPERSTTEWQDLGMVRYEDAWRLQERLREARLAGKVGNRMLMLQHPPVITLGRRGIAADVLTSEQELARQGIELFVTNRGGRATYHGPGQIVGYFIFDLGPMGLGVRQFVRAIETLLMEALAGFCIVGALDEANPGIWVGREKIAAIGLNVSHGVTQHGFALNVNCDLEPYRHIVACGISDRGVTTMERLLGRTVDTTSLKRAIASAAGRAFDCDMKESAETSPM